MRQCVILEKIWPLDSKGLGKLKITLTPEGRELLEEEVVKEEGEAPAESGDPFGATPPPKREINFKRPHADIFGDLLEYHLCNGWEMVPPEDIGALTSAPILSDDVERDDQGKLVRCGHVWWFPEYAVTSELEELMEKGCVEFTQGQDEEGEVKAEHCPYCGQDCEGNCDEAQAGGFDKQGTGGEDEGQTGSNA
jgi:hypothetical protein